MYCIHCGHAVEDGTKFCPRCGRNPFLKTPAQPGALPNAVPVLVLGIVAAVASELGLPGIIVGAIGKRKYSEYLAAGGAATGKAKVGGILSKIGLINGIVMTVLWLAYLLILLFCFGLIAVFGGRSYPGSF